MSQVEVKPTQGSFADDACCPEATKLYGVHTWGGGYFAINKLGNLEVRPRGGPSPGLDIASIIDGLEERGLSTPILLRFPDILEHRLHALRGAFDMAMIENGYQGGYTAVYPIKVNQARQVVSDVQRIGSELGFGLEIGSKAELLAIIGLTSKAPGGLIICNGFKDDEYIEAVIMAARLGRSIIPVIEGVDELRLLMKHAGRHGVRPRLGVRIKLASQGAGRWQDSSGERSKFGLFVSELLQMIEELRGHEMLECLELLHCHIGSQVGSMRAIKQAVGELAHVYVQLCGLGVGLKFIDVGGGLGIDYDGTQTDSESSINYSLTEYASDVVYRIGSICTSAGIDHPTIITECGRAMVAQHSVLVSDVVGVNILNRDPVRPEEWELLRADGEAIPQPLRDLMEAFDLTRMGRFLEAWHDAQQARRDALHAFGLGYLSLRDRALMERCFWTICTRVDEWRSALDDPPEGLEELEVILADTYFLNFSLFQSLPDSWAIDQLFPIMPIQRLNEQPDRHGVLADMTCDSDGRITRFVDGTASRCTLPLHSLRDGEPYRLGVFLVGAYQETLGDLHNLFGDTHVAHIRLLADGKWMVDEVIRGDTVAEVLTWVHYNREQLTDRVRIDCEQAVVSGRLSVVQSRQILDFYESGLSGYTYLEPEARSAAVEPA